MEEVARQWTVAAGWLLLVLLFFLVCLLTLVVSHIRAVLDANFGLYRLVRRPGPIGQNLRDNLGGRPLHCVLVLAHIHILLTRLTP